MRRRCLALLIAVALAGCSPSPPPSPAPFSVVEASIADLSRAMEEGRTTSREIVQQYLTRIALYEDRFNATLVVNPKALDEAEALDRERAAGKIRGPLHGIPIALKDGRRGGIRGAGSAL
jgi:amidase